jgi:hypothetical protein
VHERGVEEQLGRDVEDLDVGDGELVDEHGPQGVEEDLEGGEEGFAEDGVEEDGFECGGDVGVQPVDAEGLVVGEVVRLQRVSNPRRIPSSSRVQLP